LKTVATHLWAAATGRLRNMRQVMQCPVSLSSWVLASPRAVVAGRVFIPAIACIGLVFVAYISFASLTAPPTQSNAPTYDPVSLANPLPFVAASNPTAAIASNFSVGVDGSANYSIPLEAIPGPGGMTPALSLEYNSRSGNGYFGVGFNLSGVGAISRCPKNLADDKIVEPVKLDKTDPFCLGGLRLVAIKGEYGANGTEYRTNPQTFAKIVSYRSASFTPDDGPDFFVVYSRDGLISFYGLEDQDTVGTRRVSWPIVGTHDRFNNSIIYNYGKVKSSYPNLPGQVVLSRNLISISYGNSNSVAGPNARDRQVVFQYEGRPDDIHAFAHGFPRNTVERVSKVHMQRWNGSTYVTARSYGFVYKNDGPSGTSKLDTIEQCGSSIGCLPKTKFTWQKSEEGFLTGKKLNIPPPQIPVLMPFLVLDADGNGLDDIAYATDTAPFNPDGEQWRVFLAEGDGSFGAGYVMPVGTTASVPTGFAIDYDLDGRDDILPRDGGTAQEPWRPLLSRGGSVIPYSLKRINTHFNGPVNFTHKGSAQFADFDGDGTNDVLEFNDQSTDFWTIRFRSGVVSDAIKPETVAEGALDTRAFGKAHVIPELTPNSTVQVLDTDGDGRSEILFNRGSTKLEVLSFEGREASGAPPVVTVKKYPMDSWVLNRNVNRIFADVNGDGLIDMMTSVSNVNQIGKPVGTPDHPFPNLYTWFNNGAGFNAPTRNLNVEPQLIPFDLDKYLPNSIVIDHDGDGDHDLLLPSEKKVDPNGHVTMGMYLLRSVSQGWKWENMIDNVAFKYNGGDVFPIQIIDADGDGQDDLLAVVGYTSTGNPDEASFHYFQHRSPKAPPDLLIAISEGLNHDVATLAVQYQPLTGDSSFYEKGNCDRQYYNCAINPYYAVTAVYRDAGMFDQAESLSLISAYRYKNSITHKATRRWLGFAEQIVYTFPSDQDDGESLITTRRFFSNKESNRDPRLLEEWTFGRDGGKQWLERRMQIWDNKDHVVGQGENSQTLRYNYVGTHSTWSYEFPDGGPFSFDLGTINPLELDANAELNTAKYRFRQVLHDQILEMDDYGNVKRNRSFVGAGAFTTDIRTDYHPADIDNWLISRPSKVTTKRFLPPGCSEMLTCIEERIVDIPAYAATAAGQPTSVPQTVIADADHPLLKTETNFTYDKHGNVVRTSVTGDVDGLGTNATRNVYVTYDPDGVFPHAVGNDFGHVMRILHDPALGVERVVIDAKGLRTDIQYDTLGRPVKTRSPTGAQSTIAYSIEDFGGSKLARVESSDGTGAKSERVFDRLGRPIIDRFKGLDGQTRVSKRKFDTVGTLDSEDAHPVIVGPVVDTPPRLRYTYDKRGRRLSQTEPNTADPNKPYLRTWSYDKNVVTYTDTRGNKTVREYGMLGDLGRVIEAAYTPKQVIREYRKDMGQRLSKSFIAGRESDTLNEFVWDRLGRMVSRNDPDRGLTTYTYNAFGELLTSLDANSRYTRNSYDALGRLSQSHVMQASVDSVATIAVTDHVYDVELETQDKQPGKLTRTVRQDFVSKAADGSAQRTRIDYDYDAFGRSVREIHTMPSETNPAVETQYTIRYDYDQFNRIAEVTYPKLPGQVEPVRLQYSYAQPAFNGNGQLNALTVYDNDVTRNIWRLKSTDTANRPNGIDTGDGVHTHREYDWRGGLSQQALQTSYQDICSICELAFSRYSYDGEGNLESRSDMQQGVTERFEYDPLNRLESSRMEAIDGSARVPHANSHGAKR
jgi:YD repeat-containing protein